MATPATAAGARARLRGSRECRSLRSRRCSRSCVYSRSAGGSERLRLSRVERGIATRYIRRTCAEDGRGASVALYLVHAEKKRTRQARRRGGQSDPRASGGGGPHAGTARAAK